jgi:hypothetical protein
MKYCFWIGAAVLVSGLLPAIPAQAQGAAARCFRLQDQYDRALRASTETFTRRHAANAGEVNRCGRDHQALISETIKLEDALIRALRGLKGCAANRDEIRILDGRIQDRMLNRRSATIDLASAREGCPR